MLIYLQIPIQVFANRHGAAAARGAHNSEVTGSKPVAGMTFLAVAQNTFFANEKIRALSLIKLKK